MNISTNNPMLTKQTKFLCSAIITLMILTLSFSARAEQNRAGEAHTLTTITAPQGAIVLILDDMGNHLPSGQRALALPGSINYAFLPHRPHSVSLAKAAHQSNKEVLLHIPMANLHNRPTGSGALTPIMTQKQFQQTLHQDLKAIPHVRGVNNHMGSLLTQLHQPMQWLMQTLKQQQLYFIDSRTTPRTIAEQQAQHHGLPTLKRDIFLDNDRNHQAIAAQFELVLLQAKQQGLAVAIGHPYPETLLFLEQALPKLSARGFVLQLASEALAHQNCRHTIEVCRDGLKLAHHKPTTSAK